MCYRLEVKKTPALSGGTLTQTKEGLAVPPFAKSLYPGKRKRHDTRHNWL